MYYLLILVATIMFGVQFLTNEQYQKETGGGLLNSLKYSVYSSAIGFVALLIINKFGFNITLFSVAVALVYGAVCVGLNYSSIKAFQYANLSVYSVFSMIGGMLLPFVFGLLIGEEFKMIRIICCILIGVSVTLSVSGGGENNKKALKYYIGVFILNGMVGVISKFHQMYPALAVDNGSFMMLTKITTASLGLVMMLFAKGKGDALTKKAGVFLSIGAVLNSVANLLLLIALLHLPASVQYPMVTGGVIVVSVAIDLIRRKPVTKKEMLAAVVAFLAASSMAL